ncbi:hypothetical protein DFJ74DRAFT_649803 [Hyaloraphidium curvatum]|nr:hypothetical protein DFJ74DRAFT_649803 [Hyaloraphidium curvatum]
MGDVAVFAPAPPGARPPIATTGDLGAFPYPHAADEKLRTHLPSFDHLLSPGWGTGVQMPPHSGLFPGPHPPPHPNPYPAGSPAAYSYPGPADNAPSPLESIRNLVAAGAIRSPASQPRDAFSDTESAGNPPPFPRRGSSAMHENTVCSYCATTKTPLWRRCPVSGEPICNACGLSVKARGGQPPARRDVPAPRLEGAVALAADAVPGPNGGDAPVPRRGTPKPRRRKRADDESVQGSGSAESVASGEQSDASPKPKKQRRKKFDASSMVSPALADGQPYEAPKSEEKLCHNCGATNTPLWRRDDDGSTICNACGLWKKLHNADRPVTGENKPIKRRRRFPAGVVDPLRPGGAPQKKARKGAASQPDAMHKLEHLESYAKPRRTSPGAPSEASSWGGHGVEDYPSPSTSAASLAGYPQHNAMRNRYSLPAAPPFPPPMTPPRSPSDRSSLGEPPVTGAPPQGMFHPIPEVDPLAMLASVSMAILSA